nr:hypothetical protein BaRGS_005651 [Batillaria attramentaria]
MACGLVWVVGLLFAAIPLLPVTSHWEYYSQTGICIPLPVTRINFKGRYYSFGVMIVFNLVIFLMIAVGQASIYWSVRVNSMRGDSASTSKKTQDATIARRLITVALSDFLCWFPIGLLGVLASLGVPISGEVNVGMAIFVLPVNSALNPFLYTLNTILEKRRKAKKAERMKRLEEEIINKMRISASDLC